MQAEKTRAYLTKAKDFLAGMKHSDFAETECRASSALLAIHSAISYGDALWIGLGQTRTAEENHRSRAPQLKKLLNERKYEKQQGLRHLDNLLAQKTKVSYSAEFVTEQQAKSMMDHAQRFSIWANLTASELKIEGWRDGEFD